MIVSGRDAIASTWRLQEDEPGRAAAYRFQVTGDVLLTLDVGWRGTGNRFLQSLLDGRLARATHAMMVMRPGIYLDCSPRRGISFVPADHFVFDGPSPDRPHCRRQLVSVLRPPPTIARLIQSDTFERVVKKFLGAPYNRWFFLKDWARRAGQTGETSAFCSELLALVLRELEPCLLADRRPHTVYPHTLWRRLPAAGWQEVVALYRQPPAASDRPLAAGA